MFVKVNCQFNDQGPYCKNKQIPRSFFGIGTRLCCAYGELGGKCQHKKATPRPRDAPGCGRPEFKKEDI